LSCQQCSEFDREIKFSKTDEEKKIKMKGKDHHCEQAFIARQAYYHTRSKTVLNASKNDISMIIDAGGGAGCIHIPRFPTTEKGEPARHEMLKIKSTFVKVPILIDLLLYTEYVLQQVHGIGSLLCISLPDLEKQGGNLTVQCILSGIEFAMKERKIDYIRNLYIQLDNVSSNKCFTIYSVLIELVKNGILKKVKVSYLIVGHTHEDIDALIGMQHIFNLAIILSCLHRFYCY
jgi:hypothetical protein